MAFNNVIGRSDVDGIIPAETSYELLNSLQAESSHVMRLGRRLRDMTVYETDLPVLSALATAYFVDGDTGQVQTTEVNWEDKVIYAKDIACLVPVPKNVLSDARIPIWDQVKPELVIAIGAAIDLAMLYGTNKPAAWPDAIITGALAASHNVQLSGFTDAYDAILGTTGVFSLVEADGFAVSGSIADLSMKATLRAVRTTDGVPVFNSNPAAPSTYTLDGAPCHFPTNGAGSSTYPLISGDWSQLVYSMRQDMEFEVFTQGVIQDGAGNIVYNLMQQRMAAIMVVMRCGFQLPNPINRVEETEANRFPFAYLY